jgi:hypothetical protein
VVPQFVLRDLVAPADALRDFVEDVVQPAGLVSAGSLERIPVHPKVAGSNPAPATPQGPS